MARPVRKTSQPFFSGNPEKSFSLKTSGMDAKSHIPKRICHGNVTNPFPYNMPRHIKRAASSASQKNGIGHVFWSVILLRTNPGQNVVTEIPSRFNRPRRAAPKAFTAALLALYAGHCGKP